MPSRSTIGLLLLAGFAGGCCRTGCRPAPCAAGAPAATAARPETPSRQALLETTVLTVPEAEAAGVLGAAREAAERSHAVVAAAEAAAIGERANRAPGLVVLAMPSIVTALGEEATISVVGEGDVASARVESRLAYLVTPLPDAATLALAVTYDSGGRSASVRVASVKSGETVVISVRSRADESKGRVLLLVHALLLPQRDALTAR